MYTFKYWLLNCVNYTREFSTFISIFFSINQEHDFYDFICIAEQEQKCICIVSREVPMTYSVGHNIQLRVIQYNVIFT